MKPIDRRSLLKTTTLAAGSLLSSSLIPTTVTLSPKPQDESAPRFDHRGYLGWITDLATTLILVPLGPLCASMKAFKDYRQTFALMRQIGFNEISVWGLYVSRAWPVDIRSAVSPDRGALVEKLIASAHENGIRAYSGLGVYSWGFEEIIRANPQTKSGKSSGHVCQSWPVLVEANHALFPRVVQPVTKRF